MARGGARPGAGRKPKAKPPETKPASTSDSAAPRQRFNSAKEFAIWALNAPDDAVSMDQKLRAMQSLLGLEAKQPEGQSKKDAEAEAVNSAMSGRYAPRQVKGFGVVDGDKK